MVERPSDPITFDLSVSEERERFLDEQLTAFNKVPTGSLYPAGGLSQYRDRITVLNDAPHKPDEWFTMEVIAIGDHIIIKVDGKTTVDWKDPGRRYTKGHFALQGHDPGTVVKFRKIEVKELPPSQAD